MKTGVSPDYWSKAKADEVFTGSETSSSSSYYNFLNDDYIVKTYMQDPSHSSDVCRTVKSSTYCSKASDESVSVNTSHETISVSLGSFSLSKDYYISKATVVSGGYTKNNNYSIKITGVEKAIATATNKSTDTTNLLTSKLSTFYIKVPVSSVTENKTVLLKVSRTGSVECSYDEPKGYISTITDDTVQDIYVYSGVDTTTISTEKSVNDSATASIIPTTTSVRINKTDEDGKTPISGTKFMIYTDSKASTPMADQVETLSNKDGEVIFSKLIYGQTYYIKETLPAIGYKSNDTIYKVVTNTTSEIKLPITNNKTYIKISKKDIASK